MMTFLKGWRTVIFNAVVAVAAYLDPNIFPVEYRPIALLVVALANLALRTMTTTPVGGPRE